MLGYTFNGILKEKILKELKFNFVSLLIILFLLTTFIFVFQNNYVLNFYFYSAKYIIAIVLILSFLISMYKVKPINYLKGIKINNIYVYIVYILKIIFTCLIVYAIAFIGVYVGPIKSNYDIQKQNANLFDNYVTFESRMTEEDYSEVKRDLSTFFTDFYNMSNEKYNAIYANLASGYEKDNITNIFDILNVNEKYLELYLPEYKNSINFNDYKYNIIVFDKDNISDDEIYKKHFPEMIDKGLVNIIKAKKEYELPLLKTGVRFNPVDRSETLLTSVKNPSVFVFPKKNR